MWHCPQCLGRPTATPQEHLSQSEAPTCGIATGLAKLRACTKVLARIPKAARPIIADSLSSLINDAIHSPTSPASWWKFLSFAFTALRAPASPRNGEKRLTLASHLKRQVAQMDSTPPTLVVERRNVPIAPTPKDSSESLARRVRAKCADGDIRAGLRLLTSSDTFVVPTEDVITALRQKHPPAPADESLPAPAATSDPPPLTVTEEVVQGAILTMPPGSFAGLDGIRPLHLRQLLSREAAESGRRLLSSHLSDSPHKPGPQRSRARVQARRNLRSIALRPEKEGRRPTPDRSGKCISPLARTHRRETHRLNPRPGAATHPTWGWHSSGLRSSRAHCARIHKRRHGHFRRPASPGKDGRKQRVQHCSPRRLLG